MLPGGTARQTFTEIVGQGRIDTKICGGFPDSDEWWIV